MSSRVGNAIKWSGFTEIISKLISPITNMILARILKPEMFGIIATLTMVISLADVFSDSGFQKYLVYKEFDSEEELHKNANIAFWTNFGLSVFLWLIIAFFSSPLAVMIGSPGLEKELIIISITIPLTSFSSIQTALYRRDFDFKTLFIVRAIGLSIPLFVTVPLAFILKNHWSLIIGTVSLNIINACILTWKSKWKPYIFFSISRLKDMFSFSVWTLLEHMLTWMTSYVDILIVSHAMSTYWVGVYKTAMTTADQIMNIVVSTVTPVMFSSLSRRQKNDIEFKRDFLSFQQKTALLIIPMGVGIFLYRDLITYILLGKQWGIAADFIGLWGLSGSAVIILGKFCSEAFRSKGKPRLSCLVQLFSLLCIVVVVLLVVNLEFSKLAIARAGLRIIIGVINLIVLQLFIKISIFEVLKNIYCPILASIIMAGVSVIFNTIATGTIWQFISIAICIIVYFVTLFFFPSMRKIVLEADCVKNIIFKFRRKHDKRF